MTAHGSLPQAMTMWQQPKDSIGEHANPKYSLSDNFTKIGTQALVFSTVWMAGFPTDFGEENIKIAYPENHYFPLDSS